MSPTSAPPAHDDHHHKHEEFSLPLFAFTVVATLAVLLLLLRFLAPAVWEAQFAPSIWHGLVAFGVISLFNAYMEYFFHRYVLHLPAIPFLRRLYKQHTLHHALTRIVRRPSRDGRGILYIENKFAITAPEQGEASFFPWYSMALFAVVLFPVVSLLQFLLPAFPWFFGGLAALVTSITLYEVLHAINHWSFEKWAPLVVHKQWSWFWQPVYGFHLRHHAVIDCNESISGFFGLPVADWTFRTCIIPQTVYADGEPSSPAAFAQPRPVAFIAWLDRVAEQAVKKRRANAAS